MSIKNDYKNIFRNASKTHYYASRFFHESKRKDVEILYAFLRRVDDLVDEEPVDRSYFYGFKDYYLKGLQNPEIQKNSISKDDEDLIKQFKLIKSKFNIEENWVNALFKSMEMDLNNQRYLKFSQTLEYIYGVAEIVGLMMSKVMELDNKFYENAQYLGKAGQYINMVRDIDEDLKLGRIYFPKDHLDKFNIKKLDYEYTIQNKEKFYKFIKFELNYFYDWINKAKDGFEYLPKNYLVPIKTIYDIYIWTANKIKRNPMIIFERKVKPNKPFVIYKGVLNYIKNI